MTEAPQKMATELLRLRLPPIGRSEIPIVEEILGVELRGLDDDSSSLVGQATVSTDEDRLISMRIFKTPERELWVSILDTHHSQSQPSVFYAVYELMSKLHQRLTGTQTLDSKTSDLEGDEPTNVVDIDSARVMVRGAQLNDAGVELESKSDLEELLNVDRGTVTFVVPQIGTETPSIALDDVHGMQAILAAAPAAFTRSSPLMMVSLKAIANPGLNMFCLCSDKRNQMTARALRESQLMSLVKFRVFTVDAPGAILFNLTGESSSPDEWWEEFSSPMYAQEEQSVMNGYEGPFRDFGLVARVANPDVEGGKIFIAAGVRALGTHGAALAFREHAAVLHEKSNGGDFAAIFDCEKRYVSSDIVSTRLRAMVSFDNDGAQSVVMKPDQAGDAQVS